MIGYLLRHVGTIELLLLLLRRALVAHHLLVLTKEQGIELLLVVDLGFLKALARLEIVLLRHLVRVDKSLSNLVELLLLLLLGLALHHASVEWFVTLVHAGHVGLLIHSSHVLRDAHLRHVHVLDAVLVGMLVPLLLLLLVLVASH